MGNENLNLEYKREYTAEINKEVIAFANGEGGVILIGIDNDGNKFFLSNTDETLTKATNLIRDSISPDVTMFVKAFIEDDVVKIEVGEGTNKPYYITDKGLKPSGVYVRQGNSKAPATFEQIRQMIKITDGDRFEDMRSLEQKLTFIETENEFVKRKVKFETSQMRTLGLIDSGNQFTNLALLFSDQSTHTIKIAVFNGTTKNEFKTRKEFGGSVLKQLHDSYDFINLNNKLPATFSGLDRIERYDYPDEAIREALLNAIIHRDYAFSGSIIINIFDDRIEFVSIGGLVAGISKKDIMLGISQTRNEKLANIFYRLKHVEAFGTGIQKIMSLYADELRKPEIIVSDGAIVAELPNVNYGVPNAKNNNGQAQHNQVLEFMEKNNEITAKDIEKILDVKSARAYKILKEMVCNEIIIKYGKKYIKK
ncbi:MAG: putative DNA binding domain-containing protein [Oscillospiraceae bacterium]|nr:putative DNA binding domain-containing protein [Oscillospiraceae bacterium]